MQADGRMVSQGLQSRYSGTFDALNKIIRTEGFRGLWKGVFPNVQRAFLVNMGELACYDHAKHFVIQNQICGDNIYSHTLASIMSGLSATALSCPADVVKTRMMNQAVSQEGKSMYNNSYDCLVKTVRVEGLRALWKGFFPTWARLGPWQFVFWVSYEKFRELAGLSSFWWILATTLFDAQVAYSWSKQLIKCHLWFLTQSSKHGCNGFLGLGLGFSLSSNLKDRIWWEPPGKENCKEELMIIWETIKVSDSSSYISYTFFTNLSPTSFIQIILTFFSLNNNLLYVLRITQVFVFTYSYCNGWLFSL